MLVSSENTGWAEKGPRLFFCLFVFFIILSSILVRKAVKDISHYTIIPWEEGMGNH